MLGSNILGNVLSGETGMPKGHMMGVIPINDLKVTQKGASKQGTTTETTTTTTTAESILKCKLAATCRLFAKYNLTYGIYNHVTIRSPENKSFFLINPFGLNFEEVTAASLVKVDSTGNIKEKGNTPFGINKAGFILHSAIHSARPDVNCVLHVHTHAGAAVSALKKGLLPISQEALLPLSTVSYHSYEGILNEDKFRLSVAKSLGQKNKILILNNHGIVSLGATVEEAWCQLFGVLYACETQWRALASVGGNENGLILPSDAAIQQAKTELIKEQSGLNLGGDVKWGVGEMEFEAEMRYLDYRGLSTGYPYKVKTPMMNLSSN